MQVAKDRIVESEFSERESGRATNTYFHFQY